MSPAMTSTLLIAKAGAAKQAFPLLVNFGLVAVALLAMVVILIVARKLLLDSSDSFDTGGNFTLDDLRHLLAKGTITQHEFERAKACLVARERAKLHEDDDGSATTPTGSRPAKPPADSDNHA